MPCAIARLRPRKRRHCLAGQPPVLVLSYEQFEMTAHVAAVLNCVYARHEHHEPVANRVLEVARPS
jgi:hypothetical protein